VLEDELQDTNDSGFVCCWGAEDAVEWVVAACALEEFCCGLEGSRGSDTSINTAATMIACAAMKAPSFLLKIRDFDYAGTFITCGGA